MRLRPTLLLCAAALAAPAPAAAWTPPAFVGAASDANPVAEPAFGGSVATGWLTGRMSLARATGDGFGAPQPLTRADAAERVWASALTPDGSATVLTIRRHLPVQRVRAILVRPGEPQEGPLTISDRGHSAAQPHLDVAADGSAVAAWQWHDRSGWRVQAAVRLPGQRRFGSPQTISPPAPVLGRYAVRPWIHVAAGEGGRAVVAWQIGGDAQLPESDLHVHTAGPDGVLGAGQAFADAGGLADVALAVDRTGAVHVAWLDGHYGDGAPTALRVAQGTAGAPLGAATVLSRGGPGTSSGPQVAAFATGDGGAVVAWAKPGRRFEGGGTLEVFTRPAGGTFGPAQRLATGVSGLVGAGGAGASGVLAWMTDAAAGDDDVDWRVQAALRPAAGGAFGAAQTISDTRRNGLWPSVAVLPDGRALAVWVTNSDGFGSGRPAAAFAPLG